MARIRTIKPEFWADEKLSECSLSARLLFIGLISFADDEGRMDYSPARIRMQVFPCGSAKPVQLREWIGELTERSLIRIYAVDSREYLDIPNFSKHQKINRPTPSRLPQITTDSLKPHGVLSESSLTEGKGREGIMEGNGMEGSKSAPELQIPPALDLKSWERWNGYRAQIKKPIKAPSVQAAMDELAKFGVNQAAVVQQSIANSWQGLFELKRPATLNGKPAQIAPDRSAEWSEATSRAKAIGFRQPWPQESVGAYMTEIKMAETAPRTGPHALAAKLTSQMRVSK